MVYILSIYHHDENGIKKHHIDEFDTREEAEQAVNKIKMEGWTKEVGKSDWDPSTEEPIYDTWHYPPSAIITYQILYKRDKETKK